MCDCENPDPRQSDPNECFTCGEPLSEKQMFEQFLGQEDAEWCCDCFPRLLEQIKELKAVVADLETVVDEIPNMGALFGAVQELQEQYDAPANTFTHYIGGSRV